MSELEILWENIQIKSSEVQKHTVEVMGEGRCDDGSASSDLPKLEFKMLVHEKNSRALYMLSFLWIHISVNDSCRVVLDDSSLAAIIPNFQSRSNKCVRYRLKLFFDGKTSKFLESFGASRRPDNLSLLRLRHFRLRRLARSWFAQEIVLWLLKMTLLRFALRARAVFVGRIRVCVKFRVTFQDASPFLTEKHKSQPFSEIIRISNLIQYHNQSSNLIGWDCDNKKTL